MILSGLPPPTVLRLSTEVSLFGGPCCWPYLGFSAVFLLSTAAFQETLRGKGSSMVSDGQLLEMNRVLESTILLTLNDLDEVLD